ncbi:TPA: anticodon nuclease [Pasteurella multocida]|uniref:anticodon nuclease n=1 Tax=Pasteurella multocida TaxID=747 RepID=UPI0020231D84|nr:anticodon nuclease [Pasteurella multocida]MDG2541826.1 anticodon nuclease [Pasteurella multocida]URH95834.1 anticodon nuclease [Pasteurella multocida]HEA3266866.1 anticodon nuclease [Pasteurella multocida]HED4412548.1 anticodon nuclease [Pasteurella multocida]HED4413233.1 anticodon nuclease [Pasteurella multocida]
MSKTLSEIAKKIKNNKKVQLIYAFNGEGKTRLSKEFDNLISYREEDLENEGLSRQKLIYYNDFTEDLFYWNNDLKHDGIFILKIQSNSFIKWVLDKQGQHKNVEYYFKKYTNKKLEPIFNSDFTEVYFSYTHEDNTNDKYIKISKGEESNFIWSLFYSLLEQIIEALNSQEENDELPKQFENLEYIFIDDPVSSLDENHLIQLAVDLAQTIKSSKSNKLKFIITTHNPIFYNVLFNEFRSGKNDCFRLKKINEVNYCLESQNSDSPFAYQVYLKNHLEGLFKEEITIGTMFVDEVLINELNDLLQNGLSKEDMHKLDLFFKKNQSRINNINFDDIFIQKTRNSNKIFVKFFKDKMIGDCEVEKYHFNWMRNILEKLSTFLGYRDFKLLLPKDNEGKTDNYVNRIINYSSHSKQAAEETSFVLDNDKRVLKYLVEHLNNEYKFKSRFINLKDINKE